MTDLSQIEDGIVTTSRALLDLALRYASAANTPEDMAEGFALCKSQGLRLELAIGAGPTSDDLTGVRLTLNDPRTGQRVTQLFEIVAAPMMGTMQ
jgi:hypothetical protein